MLGTWAAGGQSLRHFAEGSLARGSYLAFHLLVLNLSGVPGIPEASPALSTCFFLQELSVSVVWLSLTVGPLVPSLIQSLIHWPRARGHRRGEQSSQLTCRHPPWMVVVVAAVAWSVHVFL